MVLPDTIHEGKTTFSPFLLPNSFRLGNKLMLMWDIFYQMQIMQQEIHFLKNKVSINVS
jgi:hypothetical protein